MSDSTAPSEVWNNILKDNVGKDDPLWKEYLDKAAVFDVRMVDEWNKIVDVLLVFVALFISVLTSFIIQTFTQLQRNPADITNDLLVAVYNLLAAQSNNISITPVDPRSYFNQPKADYDSAVTQSSLLYTSLSLSLTVSVIALVAKLWLVNYSRQAFSVGSPYERAMKRQEAYNGVLVWNLEGIIKMLPVILLIALFLFEFYVVSVQLGVACSIGVFLNVSVMFLGFTSLGGAFVSGCPFRSAFSDVIRFIFELFQTLSKWISCGYIAWRWLRFGVYTSLSAATAYATYMSGSWFSLFFIPAAIPIAHSAQQEVVHKPQKYKISHLALCAFFVVSMIMAVGFYFGGGITFPTLYIIGMMGIVVGSWMMSKLSKSMADTGEIDAIAWLLITAPPQHPATLFKKASQLTGFDSIGRHYRPRLLESLMPLLTLLINSYHAPEHHTSDTHSPSSKSRRNFKIELKMEQSDDVSNGRYGLPTSLSLVDDDVGPGPIDEDPHLKNLEIYTACLARLSEFADYEGSFWCLWEDAMQHPKLEQPLIDKLVVLANPRHHFQAGLRSAATKILNNYELDMEGNPVRSSATALRSVATVLRTTATLMLNVNGLNTGQQEQGDPNLHKPVDPVTRVEAAHSSGEVEEVKREPEISGSGIC